jgi:hypothetical protein
MDKFEASMSEMTKWMADMKQIMQETQNQQNTRNTYGNPGIQLSQHQVYTQHESPPSHQSKCANTRRTPNRDDPMNTQPDDESCVQLFQNREKKVTEYKEWNKEESEQQEDTIQTSPNNCILKMETAVYLQ